MFTRDQRNLALKLYDEYGLITKVINKLGYPSKQTLYLWIKNKDNVKNPRIRKKVNNSIAHPLNAPIDLKMSVLKRCFEDGENIKLASEEVGYTRTTIYKWYHRYQKYGAASLMNLKDIKRKKLSHKPVPEKDLKKLLDKMNDMQLEIDVLKETTNVIKKRNVLQ